MFLLVPAYPGCPGSKAVKRSLLLLLLLLSCGFNFMNDGKTIMVITVSLSLWYYGIDIV